MAQALRKTYPLPKRFNAALSAAAYARLRALNAEFGLSNNYLQTFLLENLDTIARLETLRRLYEAKIEEFGRPPG